MEAILLVIHVLLALALIALVLLQHGKGAEVGASFGSGASSTVFGSRGSASFLTRLTTIIAIVFFASSLVLAYLSAKPSQDRSLIDNISASQAEKSVVDEVLQADAVQFQEAAKTEANTDAVDADVPADVPKIEE